MHGKIYLLHKQERGILCISIKDYAICERITTLRKKRLRKFSEFHVSITPCMKKGKENSQCINL